MKRCLSSILLVLALAVPGAATATTFGAGVGSDFVNQVRGIWSSAQVMSSLNALYAAGGRIGRTDTDWAEVEPHAPVHGHHTYDWSADDTVVSEMAQARLRLEPTLELAPKWAQAHGPNVVHLKTGRLVVPLPPAKNADFAAYAIAFMRRYGAHGSFWAAHRSLPYVPVNSIEVWNEPDNTHNWGPHIDLQDYVKLYEAVRSAVHSVNRGTLVLTGGLAWTQSSLPRLLKALKGQPLDAVAVHPYAATPAATIALARYALEQMLKYGRGSTPLVVNEYGWTSQRNTWGSTKPRHVKPYAYQALVGLSQLRIAQILPFLWTYPSWGLSDGPFAQAIAWVSHHR